MAAHLDRLLSRFPVIVVISLAVGVPLYIACHTTYLNLVLYIARVAINIVFPSIDLTLVTVGEVALITLGVQVGSAHNVILSYDLFFIGLTGLFAPALVLATWGINAQGIVRGVLAIGFLILLQGFQITIFVLDFMREQTNTFIAVEFPDLISGIIEKTRNFMGSQFGSAMVPFLVWVSLSATRFNQLLVKPKQ
jgi:hypothetical protein